MLPTTCDRPSLQKRDAKHQQDIPELWSGAGHREHAPLSAVEAPAAIRDWVKFVVAALGAALLSHVLYAAAAAAFTHATEEHRLINVRNFPTSARTSLIEAFVESRRSKADIEVAVVGTSFSWGYSWPEDVVYSSFLENRQKKHLSVLNLSIIGRGTFGQIETLERLGANGVRTGLLIIEINPSNLNNDLKWGRTAPEAAHARRSFNFIDPYFNFFLFHPYGVNFIAMAYDQYNYRQPERALQIGQVPAGYFLMPADVGRNSGRIESLLALVARSGARVSNRVAVFFSPQLFEIARDLGYDAHKVQLAQDMLFKLCLTQQAVECVDAGKFQGREFYSNISHLNQRGHRAFARFLMDELKF
jgi:hypothetical protein